MWHYVDQITFMHFALPTILWQFWLDIISSYQYFISFKIFLNISKHMSFLQKYIISWIEITGYKSALRHGTFK